jgi:nucleoside-triphosphatase THEP1
LLHGWTNSSAPAFTARKKGKEDNESALEIVTLDGKEAKLASVGRKEPTVGRYSVHVEEFEKRVLPDLDPRTTPADLYVIDEIGKMELLSREFRTRITDLLAQPTNLLATIAKKGKGFVQQIKARNDIELIEVTRTNRDQLPDKIARKIKEELGTL